VPANPTNVTAGPRQDLPAFPSGCLLDAKQVAELLGIKPRTVYSLVDQGLLPYIRIGRRLVRFSQGDLEELYRRSSEVAP
jgi:excisionase family DNA binding protein